MEALFEFSIRQLTDQFSIYNKSMRIIEIILKLRGKLEAHSFGIPTKSGKLKMPYKKIYGLEHLAIYLLGKNATERKVVYLIYMFQIIFILIGFIML